MARILSIAVIALCFMLGGTPALAQDKSKGTAKEATAMVQSAIALLKKVGREKAFADFDNPKGAFTDRDLYIVVYDLKGKGPRRRRQRQDGRQESDRPARRGRQVLREGARRDDGQVLPTPRAGRTTSS